MVGRPRKTGKRQPNGQLARTYVNPKAQAASQPHRKAVPRKFREWPEAESEFGRAMIRGVFTPAQFEAGMRYSALASQLRAVYDIPSPTPSGIDLTRVGVSYGREMPSHVAASIKQRAKLAFEACAEAHYQATRAVKKYVIMDEPIADFDTLKLLKSALDKLVTHFGIDPRMQISKSRT